RSGSRTWRPCCEQPTSGPATPRERGQTMPEVALPGCMPEPLMGYLKALGVFRLVAEQANPAAKMSWAGGVCRLHSALDREQLADFFLNRYRPTPILAPWNGGSGFYGGGAEPLDAIAASSSARLEL